MTARGLSLTGDDFGRTPGANAGIERAHTRGALLSASLMVTGEACEDAVARARRLPGLSTGLHLALCDARAASPPRAVPGLATPDGRLPASPLRAGLRYWFRRRALRDELEREIRAQLERYLATGLPLEHLDGHHHLHMHPVVFDLLLRCLDGYELPWLRLMHEDAVAARGRSFGSRATPVPAIFAALATRQRPRLAARGVDAPDRVYGLRATGRMDAAELVRLIGVARGARVEIYLHPSETDAAGRRELEAACAPEVRRAAERAGFRLAGTRELAGGAVR